LSQKRQFFRWIFRQDRFEQVLRQPAVVSAARVVGRGQEALHQHPALVNDPKAHLHEPGSCRGVALSSSAAEARS
jgi:hypothetical protein